MSELVHLALRPSLHQAVSSKQFDSSPWPMFTTNTIGGESSCQVSQTTSTIPNNSIPTSYYKAVLSETIIDKNVVSPPTDFTSSNISFFSSKNSFHDTHPAIIDGNNLTLGMILTMSAMNQVDNPYEPRPIHPSMEQTIDWSSMMKYQHNNACHADVTKKEIALESRRPYRRRMSVEQVIEILNDIPSMDDEESLFHPSMISLCEVGGINSYMHSLFDDINCTDTNHATKNRLAETSESSSGLNMSANKHEEPSLFKPHDFSGDSYAVDMTQYSSSKKQDKNFNDYVNEDGLDHLPSIARLLRLRGLMSKSRRTQNLLQDWDKQNGLPRSHCCTMMHTNRSRRQLEEGRILPKWNGTPLIRKRCDDELRNDQPKRKKSKKKHVTKNL